MPGSTIWRNPTSSRANSGYAPSAGVLRVATGADQRHIGRLGVQRDQEAGSPAAPGHVVGAKHAALSVAGTVVTEIAQRGVCSKSTGMSTIVN